ncbi:hypothetical protein [Mycolicibacterium conceptionense]|uniref:Uncharacterized protein n=1 Tax=Mycolicibacterium conceptionense TaxID=451644 RepID=A0A1A2V871_9MYCO|nr:hypothetical protein [Mycolicibacterium conceptionense]OBF14411.1 hypothetical protein A5726_24950 [Mycolicibacterium conceptionense]OBF31697.1 hypothetical protein A5720_28095 [Mycolicibacterium conceptionense]OBH97029.1 hypothetical protein A5716_16830 [Mycolicibacterium conceptionense]
MSNERRQYVLDTDDGRRTFTARLIFDGANDTISYVDIEDYRYIPREPCICVGDCEGTRVRRCVMEDETQPELESGDNK